MTNLQYEDSGYRKKQEQKEKDDFAIGFAEWVNCSKTYYTPINELLEIYKQTL